MKVRAILWISSLIYTEDGPATIKFYIEDSTPAAFEPQAENHLQSWLNSGWTLAPNFNICTTEQSTTVVVLEKEI